MESVVHLAVHSPEAHVGPPGRTNWHPACGEALGPGHLMSSRPSRVSCEDCREIDEIHEEVA